MLVPKHTTEPMLVPKHTTEPMLVPKLTDHPEALAAVQLHPEGCADEGNVLRGVPTSPPPPPPRVVGVGDADQNDILFGQRHRQSSEETGGIGGGGERHTERDRQTDRQRELAVCAMEQQHPS